MIEPTMWTQDKESPLIPLVGLNSNTQIDVPHEKIAGRIEGLV